MVHKIGEVFDNQNRTNGFEKKRKNKKFTVCRPCCRQNPKKTSTGKLHVDLNLDVNIS